MFATQEVTPHFCIKQKDDFKKLPCFFNLYSILFYNFLMHYR